MRVITDTPETTALSPAEPHRRGASSVSLSERILSLRVGLRLTLRRLRMRRSGLKPSPVRAMTEAERAAALRLLDE